MTKDINFAVLGPHNRGKISLLVHRPREGLRLVAACGLNADGLEDYHEKCGSAFFFTKDCQAIFDNPDIHAVIICTPDYLHAEHAIAALEAGKDVFLEKPMAIHTGDCDRIISVARKSGRKLYVGHNMRFYPAVRMMRQLIDEGRIGRVEAIWCRHFISYGGDAYFKDWHSERRYTNGLLLQKASHDIDVIHYLAGGYTQRVVGMGKLSVYNEVKDRRTGPAQPVKFDRNNWPPLSQKGLSPIIDVEDHSMILMQLDNGVQASYMQCHYTPDDHRNYTIIGTEGRIENYGDHSSNESTATIHLWNTRKGYSLTGDEVFEVPNADGSHGGADPLLMEDFITFLRTGQSRGATLIDARMAVATGVQGTWSLRNGSIPMEIPPLEIEATAALEAV